MARSLTTTLSNAVSAKNRRPYINCTIEDHINHLQTSVTASNSDADCDLCIAADGSLVRVRIQRLGSTVSSFQYQRITNPTTSAQWTTWSTFSGGSANVFQDGGCAVAQDGSTTIAFVQLATSAIVNWTSSNNGVSWSGPNTVLTPPSNALTKGISTAGNADVFFIYDVSGGEAIGASFFTNAWSSIATWTLPSFVNYGSMTGLAVYWDGTIYHIIYSDGYALHLATCNSNATSWTAQQDIAPAANVNAITRLAPRIAAFDNLYNLICVEADAGGLTGTIYSYPRLRQSSDLVHWSNGTIMQDVNTTYGVNLVKTTPPSASRAVYVLSAMSGIQLNNDFQSSDTSEYLDVSSKILSYKRVDQLDHPGTLELVLDNANNAIGSAITNYGSGSYNPIGLGTLVVLNEGYYTGTPPTSAETVNTGRYHIQKITIERAPGENQLHLTCRDLTYLLDQENRYQVTYTNQTVSYMIQEVCAKAGLLNYSLPGTSQMSTNIVLFTLHAGQRYRAALLEICRVGWLEYFLDQTETLQFRELSSNDSSVWSYQPEIESWSIGTDDIRENHVIVTGKPPVGGGLGAITVGEAYDMTHIHAVGLERLLTSNDQKLVTAALCADSAAFILQQTQRDQYEHVIEVPANPALQLLDVITTTDTSVQSTGVSNTSRILKQDVVFDATKATYSQTIELQGV
jgi:hypothetical protein